MCIRSLLLLFLLSLVPAATTLAEARLSTEAGDMLLRSDRSESLLATGRHLLYAFRMPEAEQTFRRLARQPDGGAAAYYHLAQAALLKALMTDEGEAFDAFFVRSDSLSRLLDAAPASPWRDYLEAEAQLQRGLAFVKRGNHVRAAWAARSAYFGFRRLVREQPQFHEAYKGLGLLHVCIGALPGTYRGLLKILGFEGSVKAGQEELEAAFLKSRYNREEAAIYRALTRMVVDRTHPEDLERLRQLHARYAGSPLFAHVYGLLLLRDRQAAAAERVLRAAAARSDDPAYVYVDYIDYYLADALVALGRFREAEAYYRRYLDRHDGPALKARAHYDLGLVLELQGRRDEALVYYRRVTSPRGFDSDGAARRRAQRRLEAPLSAIERQLIEGQLAYDSGRYDVAVPILKRVLADASASDVERAEAAYRLGRVHQAAERYDEALAAYRHAVEHPVEGGFGWTPWSQFYIGEIHALRGDKAKAREAFERARAFKGEFDYSQGLDQSVRSALERLEKGS